MSSIHEEISCQNRDIYAKYGPAPTLKFRACLDTLILHLGEHPAFEEYVQKIMDETGYSNVRVINALFNRKSRLELRKKAMDLRKSINPETGEKLYTDLEISRMLGYPDPASFRRHMAEGRTIERYDAAEHSYA